VQYPAVDPVGVYEHGFHLGGLKNIDARYLMSTYTGGTPSEVPERYHAIAGTTAITRQAPPTLVISPLRDSLVPADGVRQFAHAAKQAGVAVDLVEMPLANHSYDQITGSSIGEQARRTITLAWLRSTLRPVN